MDFLKRNLMRTRWKMLFFIPQQHCNWHWPRAFSLSLNSKNEPKLFSSWVKTCRRPWWEFCVVHPWEDVSFCRLHCTHTQCEWEVDGTFKYKKVNNFIIMLFYFFHPIQPDCNWFLIEKSNKELFSAFYHQDFPNRDHSSILYSLLWPKSFMFVYIYRFSSTFNKTKSKETKTKTDFSQTKLHIIPISPSLYSMSYEIVGILLLLCCWLEFAGDGWVSVEFLSE